MALMLRDTTRKVLRVLVGSTGQMVNGYQMHQRTGVGYGQIYPILRGLEGIGLVRSRDEAGGRGATPERPRTGYALTEVGVCMLRGIAPSSASA